jgi:hypothetical protein
MDVLGPGLPEVERPESREGSVARSPDQPAGGTEVRIQSAPSKSAKIRPDVLSVLDDWIRPSDVCRALGTWVGDVTVSNVIYRLHLKGVLERRAIPGPTGRAFQYRKVQHGEVC